MGMPVTVAVRMAVPIAAMIVTGMPMFACVRHRRTITDEGSLNAQQLNLENKH